MNANDVDAAIQAALAAHDAALAAAAAAAPAAQPRATNLRKLMTLSSGTGEDWINWRKHFEIVQQLSGWDNRRSRLEVGAAMTETAMNLTSNVPLNAEVPAGANDADAVAELLDEYEACFLPPAASDMAQAQVKSAKQTENEDVQRWHSRVTLLYRRAYPALTQQQLQDSQDLRGLFILGIADAHIRERVHEARPNNLNAALTSAVNLAATRMLMHPLRSWDHPVTANADPTAAIKREPGTFAMSGPQPGRYNRQSAEAKPAGKCHICGRSNHYMRDCFYLKEVQEKYGNGNRQSNGPGAETSKYKKDNRVARGRGGAKGGRGSFRGKARSAPRNPGGFKGNNAYVATMSDANTTALGNYHGEEDEENSGN